ncbi:DUF885 domain-containing protein [Myxococcota bacterium]|nr:DUF885 domain-containing protein [Myxococcota bacterium]
MRSPDAVSAQGPRGRFVRPQAPCRAATLVLALMMPLVGCGGGAPRAARPDDRVQLADIVRDFWGEQMRHAPTWATYLGDRSRDAELGRASSAEHERHLRTLANLAGRLEHVPRAGLTADERVSADMLAFLLRRDLDTAEKCQARLWAVDQLAGPQVTFAELPNVHTVTTAAQGRDLLARYQQMDEYFGDVIEGLREGLGRGLVAPKINVERVLRQIDEMLAVPVAKSPYLAPVFAALDAAGGGPAGLGEPFRAQLTAAVEQAVYGGLRAYRAFLANELLPRARASAKPGVGALPIGAACYAARIKGETGVSRTADEIFALGEAEVARIEKEMAALVQSAGGGSLPEYLKSIAARADQYAASPEALLEYNRELMTRAMRALPRAFGRLPKTVIEVKAIEDFRAKDAPAAYYYGAPQDASRPAFYYVNTHRPEIRLLYKMPALAFHEAVPGHHLQIALASENTALPVFQREMGHTAFVEGWALYAEGLADELGLYRTADEKLGQLSYEMWRAVRLVVDAGLHAKGWSREQAIDYLVAKTGHRREESENEIDRYIIWPGQALAYKVGELEIRALRRFAQDALGAQFDLRAFHDRLLAHGAIPLDVARREIEAWVAEVKGGR